MPDGVLVVSEVFPPTIGGSGVLLENVYRRLSGCQVRVIAGEAPAGERYEGPLEVSHVSFDAPDWGLRRPRSLIRHLRVAARIRQALGRAPAVVHCARALPEGLSARMALAGRFLCWLHGEELGYASTSRELAWLSKAVYRRAAAVIANSHNSKRLLTEEWGIPEHRVHVVYPGVDIDRFHPMADGRCFRQRVARPGDVVLLSVGRLDRRKGHDMVLRAMARLQRAHLRYVIVGDGPHMSALRNLTAELGLTSVVHFEGKSREEDLPGWYRAADIFVLPNRTEGVDFEGFGIVFLEAAASGLPVIGGASGGVPEAVAQQVTGLLVNGADADMLATAIGRLADDERLRAAFGQAGRSRVVEQFTWERAAAAVRLVHDNIGSGNFGV